MGCRFYTNIWKDDVGNYWGDCNGNEVPIHRDAVVNDLNESIESLTLRITEMELLLGDAKKEPENDGYLIFYYPDGGYTEDKNEMHYRFEKKEAQELVQEFLRKTIESDAKMIPVVFGAGTPLPDFILEKRARRDE